MAPKRRNQRGGYTPSQIREALENRAKQICGALPGGYEAYNYVPEHIVLERCRPKTTRKSTRRRPATNDEAGPSQPAATREETSKLERMRRSNPAPKRREHKDLPDNENDFDKFARTWYHEESLRFISYAHARFDTLQYITKYPDPNIRFEAIAKDYMTVGKINFGPDKNLRGLIASLSLQEEYV